MNEMFHLVVHNVGPANPDRQTAGNLQIYGSLFLCTLRKNDDINFAKQIMCIFSKNCKLLLLISFKFYVMNLSMGLQCHRKFIRVRQ